MFPFTTGAGGSAGGHCVAAPPWGSPIDFVVLFFLCFYVFILLFLSFLFFSRDDSLSFCLLAWFLFDFMLDDWESGTRSPQACPLDLDTLQACRV